MKKSLHLARLACIGAALSLLVPGCTSTPERNMAQAPDITRAPLSESARLLESARNLSSPAREQKQLDAVPLLIAEGNMAGAENLLNGMALQKLPAATRARIGIALADIAVRKGRYKRVLTVLDNREYGIADTLSSLPLALQNQVSMMRALAQEKSGDPVAALKERVFAGPMLDAKALPENNEKIWATLVSLPQDAVAQLGKRNASPDMLGWLSLLSAFTSHQDDLDGQLQAVEQWSRQNVAHPANQAMPKAISTLKALADQRPARIALLLPQSGPLRSAAEAIERGFMAAYFQAGQSTPGIEKRPPPEIRIYDESNGVTFMSNYQRAVAEGAEMVVGPLSKDNVRALYQIQQKLPVPTLALNSSDLQNAPPAALYQFGLSPEDDARAAAMHAAARGFTNAAILYQDNGEWSTRVLRAFTQQWQALGHRITGQASYKVAGEMEAGVKSLLLLEDSQRRARQVSTTLGEPVASEPRPRADLDFVFLITPGEQSRQVKPLFDFHYAKTLPLIGGSYLFSPVAGNEHNRDMDEIEFCDIPWILAPSSPVHTAFNQAWRDADPRMGRLNALGVDAYRLAERLGAMAQVPEARLHGATGVISLDEQGRLQRGLSWARFSNGEAWPLPANSYPDLGKDADQDRKLDTL